MRDTGVGENTDRKTTMLRHKDGHGSTLHGEEIAGGKHVVDGSSNGTQEVSGSQGGTSVVVVEWDDYGCRIKEELVDWDDYGCRVVEEPPPDT